MSNGHGSSRRQAYGRRMKELRTRRDSAPEVDMEGPSGWSRGAAWDEQQPVHRASPSVEHSSAGMRSR
jgi:hypothetical protein